MQIDSKLSKANFDKTDEGTVISVIDKEEGIYLVQIQNSKFEAYSTGPKYYEGDYVYINIPRSDYTQQKFIVGRKMDEESTVTQTFAFRYPFDDFISLYSLTGNNTQTSFLNAGAGQEKQYHANDPDEGAEPNPNLTNIETDPNLIWHWYRRGEELIGTTLGLQMDVKSYLAHYNPLRGGYGLKILVRGDIRREDGHIDADEVQEYYFVTDDMYGNPYGFIDPATQQLLIRLDHYQYINEIAAYFWQDHKFIAEDSSRIPYLEQVFDPSTNTNITQKATPNLVISDFSAGFGLMTEDIENEKLYLYTYDEVTFGEDARGTTARASLDTRTMHFAWIHKLENDEFTTVNSAHSLEIFNQSIEQESRQAHIYWYRQVHNPDEVVDGTPYVPPKTSIQQLEAKILELTQQRDEVLAAMTAKKDTYSSENSFNLIYGQMEAKYNNQIRDLEAMKDDTEDTALQRISIMAGLDYRLILDATDQFEYTTQMDIQNYKERFKVVVAWDGTYEVSDPIEFTNVDTSILQDLQAARNEIVFRLLRSEKYKDNNGQYKIRVVEDNALGNFFVYDENNEAIKNENNEKYSELWYYIQIWIWNQEANTYVPITTEAAKDSLTVEWIFPTRDSMLQNISTLNQDDLSQFSNSLIPVPNDYGAVNVITRKFQINKFWDMRAKDNVITAIINRNGKQTTIQKLLRFGQSGSTGSKYTIRLDLTYPANTYTMVKNQKFEIEATIYEQDGTKTESNAFTFSYSLINDGPCRVTTTQSEAIGNASTWGLASTQGYSNNKMFGYLRTDYPPLIKVEVNLHDPDYQYKIETVRGFMSTNNWDQMSHWNIGCPERVEYKSDGTTPFYDTGKFTVETIENDPNKQIYLFPTWHIKQFLGNSLNEATAENIKYVSLIETAYQRSAYNTNSQFTNPTAGYVDAKEYALSLMIDNNKRPREQQAYFWQPEMESDAKTFIGFEYNGVKVYQAIAFARNVYASSIINSWDQQLLIDKEKNAILTRMLSAGVKDRKNRFSGVMMGDWSDYGDSSIDPIGLYGFKEGVQTFGFKADGTGFIGSAGYGQITFDGVNALISDYDKSHYINLNPVIYTLDANGNVTIDKDRKGYSQYFLYAKNKTIDTTNRDTTNVGTDANAADNDNNENVSLRYLSDRATDAEYGFLNTKWVKTFEEDTAHDYFVVDPNNGVYMSGGIIASYGKIGKNLEVSSAGLTYKNNYGIIFIGQERTRDGKLITSSHTTTGYDDVYWSSQKGDKYNFRTGTKPSATTGRYIVWVGDVNSSGRPKYLYPNFGLEHDGTVHLNRAFVQGEIHASSLQIGMDDGEYHDSRSRFARTYYSDNNPAYTTNHNPAGICHNDYGDMLIAGDLWYDTNVSVNVNDIATFALTVSNKPNTNTPTALDNSTPAVASDIDFDVSDLSTKATRGYVCYEWLGYANRTTKCYEDVIRKDNNGNPVIQNGQYVIDKVEVAGHEGWKRCPVLSKDTLTEISTMALKSSAAIKTLQKELTRTLRSAYDKIRMGMSPVSFFQDGECYISISKINTTVTGIGSVPAGLAIYQVKSGNVYDGSCFLLNGKRMGFYMTKTENNKRVDVPLLTYYEGNMGLAGSLAFGLNFTKALDQTDQARKDISLYQNYLDGPNAKICLGNGAIVLNSGLKKNDDGTVKGYEPSITLGGTIVDDTTHNIKKAVIKLAGYKIEGNTESDLTASFGLGCSATNTGDGTNHTADEKGHAFDKWSPQEGNNIGTNIGDSIRVTYNVFTVGGRKNYKIGQLNYFKIVNEGRGMKILENETNFTEGTTDTTSKHHFTLIVPEKTTGTHENYIVNWDLVDANTGSFKNLETTSLFCQNLYVYSGTTAVEIADKKWVTEKLYQVYTKLSALISSAQKTGNKAYGTATHHSHNASGRVSTDGADWHN